MADLDALRYRHDELRRALDIQRETVDVLHARANVILVATLGVSAFLGTGAAANAGTAGVGVGIAGLAVTVALFAAILRPRKWGWYISTQQLAAEELNHPRVGLEALLAGAIPAMRDCSTNNVDKIADLARLIVSEAIAAGVTTAIWLVLTIP